MMADVNGRKLVLIEKYSMRIKVVALFYSRIILNKLNNEELSEFRKLEKNLKICTKCDADVKYLELKNT